MTTAESIINNLKATNDYIKVLNNHLAGIVWNAINKADAEYEESNPDYYGSFKRNIGYCYNAEFGDKMSPMELYNKIMRDSKSTKPFVKFIEDDVISGSHYYDIPTEYVRMIAKHLEIEN